MKKIMILLISLMVISVGFLSGCNEISNPLSGVDERFVGTWKSSNMFHTFFSDGSGSYGGYTSTWELKDEKLVVYRMDEAITLTYAYSFSNNNTTLTLTNVMIGMPEIYTKQ